MINIDNRRSLMIFRGGDPSMVIKWRSVNVFDLEETSVINAALIAIIDALQPIIVPLISSNRAVKHDIKPLA
ncbi:hypothetical protein [Streptomyces hydrogenans]|uniref:hypothetical protein n=1 Tax=Streptomyces hydrogenans TaxID=1873719 RepID=UPI0035DD9BAF